jgi:hypothetical protein
MPFLGLIFSFFGSPFGKIAGYVLAVVAIIGALWAALAIHDSHVANAAREAFNAQQLAIVQEENATYLKQIQTLEASEKALQAQVAIDDANLSSQTEKTITVIKTIKPNGCFDSNLFNKTLSAIKGKKK